MNWCDDTLLDQESHAVLIANLRYTPRVSRPRESTEAPCCGSFLN